jgi:shikimate kinase
VKLTDLADALGLGVAVGSPAGVEATGAYVSDLLSDVMAHAEKGSVWITLQVHQNIVAVATLKELAAIVIVGGREPEQDAADKARRQGIAILTTKMTAFEVAGRMYELGLRSGPVAA